MPKKRQITYYVLFEYEDAYAVRFKTRRAAMRVLKQVQFGFGSWVERRTKHVDKCGFRVEAAWHVKDETGQIVRKHGFPCPSRIGLRSIRKQVRRCGLLRAPRPTELDGDEERF
jgi:hypothetical protein